MKRFLLLAICLVALTLQVFAQDGFTTKPDERAINIAKKFIASWQKSDKISAGKFGSPEAVKKMFSLNSAADEKIEFNRTEYLPKEKRWNYEFVFVKSENMFALQIVRTKRSFRIVAVEFYFPTISNAAKK